MSTNAQTASQPAAETKSGAGDLKTMSDADILRLIESAKEDPFAKLEVLRLQKIAMDQFESAVNSMAQCLTKMELPVQPNRSSSIVALQSEARARQANGKKKIDLARNIVLAAIINRNNPDWNVLSTEEPAPGSKESSGWIALLSFSEQE